MRDALSIDGADRQPVQKRTGLAHRRVILCGTFDRFPRFQILIGHMGEALPFMLPRLDTMNVSVTKLNRPISAYLRENVYYTFSGSAQSP